MTLIDITSPDDGLTLNQLAQKINEYDSYKIQRALQLLKRVTLLHMRNMINDPLMISSLNICSIYSEKAKDDVFLNVAGNREYLEGFMQYLGFNIPDNGKYVYLKTRKGGGTILLKKDELRKYGITFYKNNPEAEKYFTDYHPEDSVMQGLKGRYTTEQGLDEFYYLVDGVTDLLRTAGKKGMTNVEMTHILLPESKNASGPAFGSYLDKIDDAVYFLEEYVFKE